MKENDNSKLIHVFVGSPWEAEVVKGLLKSNNIEAGLKDGNLLGTLAPYSGNEVAVLVNREDYEVASEIVQNRESAKDDE